MNIFDSGSIRIAVPDGWMAFCGTDSGGKVTPKKVHIYKGIKTETDIFSHAGITVCFFGKEDYYLSPRGFYDNITDIDAFTLGEYTWNGYTCTSFGYPYTMLDARTDGCVIQVMILMKNGNFEISLTDGDVRAIIESITPAESVLPKEN